MDHDKYLHQALDLAKVAYAKKEVPIGAVLVDATGKVIARGYNQTLKKGVLGHAEVMAIQAAAKKLGDWRLEETRLYVTLEPCLMCLGAALLSRVKEVHFVLSDPTFGSVRTVFSKTARKGAYKNLKFVHHPELEREVSALMKSFFTGIRQSRAGK